MPKFNLSINGVNEEAAEGREQWSGPLPPKGSYPAVLKMVKVKKIKNKNDNRLQIMVLLNTDDEYNGCPVFGGVNLTDQGIPYVNQFLQALTDGSDAQFTKIKKAFYAGFVVDEKKENVLKIGTWKINSPEGELPVRISLTHSTWEGKTNPQISSFLLPDSGEGGGSAADDEPVAEEDDDDADVDADDDESDDDDDDDGVFDEDDDE